ncbi:hypothetical protein IKC_05129 [Bacillus cereus VD184]|uniref:Uncharacterized protein n=1 Tax=Bacillus cereus VD184 TaxID=1053242 RepID=A0A9W5VUN3_BACCE|nr:hypothetical protein [Bacillus cereus]EOQ18628.1 hypothetical protein IKC_05129 [Bacillus cereus VD184]
MPTNLKRLSLTLLPEWEEELDELKREKFYTSSKAEMLRYLISLGLKTSKELNNKEVS